jgi:orotidine-5'-phosphate decarboxylase
MGKLPWKRPCKVVGDYPGFYILQCADGKKYIVLDTVLNDIPETVEAIYKRAKEICPDCE